MKLNEKISSFRSAKLLKEFREEIIAQAKSYHIEIEYDKYTKLKKWKTYIPRTLKEKLYKTEDFISRGKDQVKLLIIENTQVKILPIELDYYSEECDRIYHMSDVSYFKEFFPYEEEIRFITVRDYKADHVLIP
jgi:hypothetical protein